LKNGATWYKENGLYWMQYGAPEVFKEINAFVVNSPEIRVIASPYWANGTSMLARYFMDDLDPLRWGVVEDILAQGYPIRSEDIFMMLPVEYEWARSSEKIEGIDLISTIDYPDGRPGFRFARIKLGESP
jgi:hypothetical protein